MTKAQAASGCTLIGLEDASIAPVRGVSDVVILNDYAHVNGGAGQVALSTAEALAERGYRVTLLAAVAPVAQELEEAGVRVILTGQYDIKSDPVRVRAATQGLWNPRAARALMNILSRCDPADTIVHVHGWCKALSSSVVHAALSMNFQIVVTLHDYFYACPTGGFFNFPRREICKLKPLSAACLMENCDRDGYAEKVWRSVRQGIQDHIGFGGTGIRHFITLSHLSETVLTPSLPHGAKLHRIPNPIDVDRAEPVDVGRNTQFISVGRLSPEKGFGLFARAAKDLGCGATFVGEGPSRDEISGIYPEARITGWLSRSEVRNYFRSARALVFPSLLYEAQPLVVLEAAALGVPAIVPDQCAAKEAVDPEVTGLWFRTGDLSDLREKIAILRDPQVAARMGRTAYERYWHDPLTMERHLFLLQECYRLILGSCSLAAGKPQT